MVDNGYGQTNHALAIHDRQRNSREAPLPMGHGEVGSELASNQPAKGEKTLMCRALSAWVRSTASLLSCRAKPHLLTHVASFRNNARVLRHGVVQSPSW